jgi:hypothetical protein
MNQTEPNQVVLFGFILKKYQKRTNWEFIGSDIR